MQTCAQCKLPARHAQQCGACKSVFYCNKECQKSDWKAHKKECRLLAADAQAAVQSSAIEFLKVQEHVSGAVQTRHARQLFVSELNVHLEASRYERVLEMQAEAIVIAEAMRDDLAWDIDAEADDVAPHVRIAVVYATLGSAMRLLGDYHKGLAMCRQAMIAIDRVAAPMHPCKIPFLLKLSFALTDLRHDEEALGVLRQVEEITLEGPDNMRLVALGALTSFFIKRDDFDQAVEYYPQIMELSVALGDKMETACSLNEFAYAMMMAGDAPRAYMLHKESLHLANEIQHRRVQARAVTGMARCIWAMMRSPEKIGSDEQRGLVALDTHLSDARRLLQNDSEGLHGVYGRVIMLTAFQQHLVGESESALEYALELLTLAASGSHLRCSSCWQKRDDDYPLLKCVHCRVARFCNRDCQEEGSAGRECTNTRHIVAHRYVCEMLRVQRLLGKAVAAVDVQKTGDLTHNMHGLVRAFLRRMTAGVLTSSLASAAD